MAQMPRTNGFRRSESLNTEPVYMQLRDIMVERIRSQHWKSGATLPNEFDLSKEFSVSVGTVRKAMAELTNQGLVTRHQGRGTFVADRQHSALFGLFDRLRNNDGSPIEWERPKISVQIANATDRERDTLGLRERTEEVIRTTWIRSTHGRPLGYQICSISSDRFPGAADMLQGMMGLSHLYRSFNIICATADSRLSMSSAPPVPASSLNVDEGANLMKMDRITYDIDHVPIEVSEAWFKLETEYYWSIHSLRSEQAEFAS